MRLSVPGAVYGFEVLSRSAPVSPSLRTAHVLGNAAQDDEICRHLAAAFGAVVAAVDYRLAPEPPFPAPLYECHDALAGLRAATTSMRDVSPSPARALAVGSRRRSRFYARERAEVRPVIQLLTYPMLDDTTVVEPSANERDLRLWNTASNRFGWRSFLGAEPVATNVSGLAAPGRGIYQACRRHGSASGATTSCVRLGKRRPVAYRRCRRTSPRAGGVPRVRPREPQRSGQPKLSRSARRGAGARILRTGSRAESMNPREIEDRREGGLLQCRRGATARRASNVCIARRRSMPIGTDSEYSHPQDLATSSRWLRARPTVGAARRSTQRQRDQCTSQLSRTHSTKPPRTKK